MQPNSRVLYEQLLDYAGEDLFREVLRPWVIQQQYSAFLDQVRDRFSEPMGTTLSDELSWELYGLSRVLDLLTMRFQPDRQADQSNWGGPVLSLEEYIAFARLLGCTVSTPKQFTSFYCESLEAQPATENFSLQEVCFPAFMLGNLLIKRAGVIIGVNPSAYDLARMNQAQIYWAFRRKNRPYQDLSHG
ncbi:MAG: hypothetical protein AAF598_05805 [Bacteroidota bacterium]